jgi:hypothetical protein
MRARASLSTARPKKTRRGDVLFAVPGANQ